MSLQAPSILVILPKLKQRWIWAECKTAVLLAAAGLGVCSTISLGNLPSAKFFSIEQTFVVPRLIRESSGVVSLARYLPCHVESIGPYYTAPGTTSRKLDVPAGRYTIRQALELSRNQLSGLSWQYAPSSVRVRHFENPRDAKGFVDPLDEEFLADWAGDASITFASALLCTQKPGLTIGVAGNGFDKLQDVALPVRIKKGMKFSSLLEEMTDRLHANWIAFICEPEKGSKSAVLMSIVPRSYAAPN